MKLANSFSTETRELFRDTQWICAKCGGNGQGKGGVELHHILGRDSNSPLNACVLCKDCHSHVGHTEKEHIKLLTKTLIYLKNQGYKFNSNDFSFIRKNYQLYQKILKNYG